MDAIKKKSYEVQAQVRHNAEDFRNTLNDLYSWEKEIKDKEQTMKKVPEDKEPNKEQLKTLPIRSHVNNDSNKQEQQQEVAGMASKHNKTAATDLATTPVEKVDAPTSLRDQKRKEANEIKDRGNQLVKVGQYEEAIGEYSAAIKLVPEDAVYHSNRALCYLKLERYNECINDCERAIDLDKLAVKAYYRRMQANINLGNNMDALKDCTTVLMIEPKNAEAKKSLERINERLRKNVKSVTGPNFSALRDNILDISPIEKPPYKRSNKKLRRVPIADVVGPKDSKNHDNANLKISDEDIDKLFNSNCGSFVEVKHENKSITKTATKKVATPTPKPKPGTFLELEEPKQGIVQLKSADTASTSKAAAEKATPLTAIDSNKLAASKTAAIRAASTLMLDENRPLPPAPTSTAQFYSNWKELAPAQKFQYLKSIEVPQLCKLLGAGFDSDTLTDVLLTLRDYYLPQKEEKTADTLLEISKNNQVTILSMLMSSEERKVLSDILNSIKEVKSNTSIAALIAKNFNLH